MKGVWSESVVAVCVAWCGVWCGRFYSFEGGNLSCRNAVVDPANSKHYNMAQAFTAIGWAGNWPVIANASGTTARHEAHSLGQGRPRPLNTAMRETAKTGHWTEDLTMRLQWS